MLMYYFVEQEYVSINQQRFRGWFSMREWSRLGAKTRVQNEPRPVTRVQNGKLQEPGDIVYRIRIANEQL